MTERLWTGAQTPATGSLTSACIDVNSAVDVDAKSWHTGSSVKESVTLSNAWPHALSSYTVIRVVHVNSLGRPHSHGEHVR